MLTRKKHQFALIEEEAVGTYLVDSNDVTDTSESV